VPFDTVNKMKQTDLFSKNGASTGLVDFGLSTAAQFIYSATPTNALMAVLMPTLIVAIAPWRRTSATKATM